MIKVIVELICMFEAYMLGFITCELIRSIQEIRKMGSKCKPKSTCNYMRAILGDEDAKA